MGETQIDSHIDTTTREKNLEEKEVWHKRLRAFVIQHERSLSAFAFLFGVVWDNLTLTRIDQALDLFILSSYLVGAGGAIILLNLAEAGRLRKAAMRALAPFFPLLVQFFLGGVLSGFFVFYSRSGSMLTSWPFLVILLALLIGNEFIKHRYTRLIVNISIYYFALFSFSIFIVPIVTKHIRIIEFLISGAVSLLAIALFVYVLKLMLPNRVHHNRRRIVIAISAIYLSINTLYFFNLIPPIPLSLKEVGVYHSVVREGAMYRVHYEDNSIYRPWRTTAYQYHWDGSPVYVFASIFAPTRLETTVFHNWQFYNEQTKRWESRGTVAYSIIGGRDNGYRGYTQKSTLEEGKWRVRVTTARGAVLGQATFELVRSTGAVMLTEDER